MEEDLKKLERKILLDFYEKNNNPQVEVLLDYKRVYARYIDRKSYLWEGEAISDGFVDMKTKIALNETLQCFQTMNINPNKEETVSLDKLSSILSKESQRLISMNKERGIDVKIIVCSFDFCSHNYYLMKDDYFFRSLMMTYKIERI